VSDQDIGTFLEVPEDQREDVDPSPEYNSDAGFDVQVVPDGVYAELSTASDDEPLASEVDGGDEGGDGTPVAYLTPGDPEYSAVDFPDEED
jgi:hypothetical protein